GPLSRPARSVTASSSTPPSPATTRSSTPSLHDALPICAKRSNTLFFQHLNGGQTFGSHRDFHHNARNGVAQALRFFHHTLRVTTHSLSKQNALITNRFLQTRQNFPYGLLAGSDNARVSCHPGNGEYACQTFDFCDVSGVQIQFHDVSFYSSSSCCSRLAIASAEAALTSALRNSSCMMRRARREKMRMC